MAAAELGVPGDGLYLVHQWTDLGLLGVLVVYSLWKLAGHRSHGWAYFFPWFSKKNYATIWSDVRTLLRLRVRDFPESSALSGAVHGLGLLAAAAMQPTAEHRCTPNAPTTLIAAAIVGHRNRRWIWGVSGLPSAYFGGQVISDTSISCRLPIYVRKRWVWCADWGWGARRFFAANSPAIGKNSNAVDRPSPRATDRRELCRGSLCACLRF